VVGAEDPAGDAGVPAGSVVKIFFHNGFGSRRLQPARFYMTAFNTSSREHPIEPL
jgi:hypothetical protein